MSADKIREPDCPGCGRPPGFGLSPVQVFCTNDECDVFCWDATKTRAENQQNATYIDLSGLPGVDQEPPEA